MQYLSFDKLSGGLKEKFVIFFLICIPILATPLAHAWAEERQHEVLQLLEEANSLAFEREYPKAIAKYQEALQHDRTNIEIRRSLLKIYLRLGDFEAALEQQHFLATDEPTKEDLFLLGFLSEQTGNYEMASRFYRDTVEVDPSHFEARLRLALVLGRAGSYRASVKEIKHLFPTTEQKVIYVFGFIRRLLLPLLPLISVFILSKIRQTSEHIKINQSDKRDDSFPILRTIMIVWLGTSLIQYLAFNPFSSDYWYKILFSVFAHRTLFEIHPASYYVSYVSLAISSMYFIRRCGISMSSLFVVNRENLGKIIGYSLFGTVQMAIVSLIMLGLGDLGNRQESPVFLSQFSTSMKLFALAVSPIAQEVYFRGLVLLLLLRRYKVTWSILFSSVFFAACHLDIHVLDQTVLVIFGAIWAFVFQQTRSLWPSSLLHAAWTSLVFFSW